MRHVESMAQAIPPTIRDAEVDGRDGVRSIASRDLDT
jgi:hypothetical protein